jgi:hypothetical protein
MNRTTAARKNLAGRRGPGAIPGRVPVRRTSVVLLPVLAFLMAGAFVLTGCGQTISKPEETPGGYSTVQGTYALTYVWNGFPGTTDVVVTKGGYVYVAQESARVVAYKTFASQPHPLIAPLENLVKPVLLAEGPNEEIYVADAGDMTVKHFPRGGGAPIQTFTDPEWAVFGGIAVDNNGSVYVADRQKDFIWKYTPSGQRDTLGGNGVLSESGAGIGYVSHPSGLSFTGTYLLVTDTGHQQVKELATDAVASCFLFVNGPSPSDPFSSPLDSDTDEGGNIYVADTGKNRVLKYDGSGVLKATVNWDASYPMGPTVAVAARDVWVYVADPQNAKILIYELR